ncbi:hypothetical protein FHW77_002902 [Agrobacterium sp. RC10-4-1]|nr:hypothetical protein [Agrobacterium sp. RC10-4-1]
MTGYTVFIGSVVFLAACIILALVALTFVQGRR